MRFLAPVLIGLAGAGLLIALGLWQVQRLAWKEAILTDIDAQLVAEPMPVPDAPDAEAHRFLPVVLEGQARARELHVLIGHKKLGPGFRVVTAFETDAGRRLLLDAGFVSHSDKESARTPLGGTVIGNLHWPDDRNDSTPANDTANNIWFARDLAQMATVLDTEPVLVVLRRAGGLDASITPMPLDSSSIPNDHLNYAITWFSLAIVWLGMTVFWLWRIRRRTN